MKRSTAIVSSCLIFALAQGCSPARHYHEHHSGEALFRVLRKQVSKGDSVERVQELLGLQVQAVKNERMVNAVRKLAAKFPKHYPDGAKDNDLFLACPVGDNDNLTYYLQFRDGHLINFRRKDFAKYEEIMGSM